MSFPLELEKSEDGGLVFAVKTGEPVRVKAVRCGKPISIIYNNVTDVLSERIDAAVKRRGGDPRIVNAYCFVEASRELHRGTRGDSYPQLRIFTGRIQLYSISDIVADEQRARISHFQAYWEE